MHKNRLWLLFIIAIGFVLRLTLLGEQSLWYDEGVTWLLSQMRALSDLIQWTAADIQPPLYYLLIWGIDILFGHSEWALRFPSVIFNTLTMPLIYVLAHRLWPDSRPRNVFPLLAVALFALSPLMVYYSQEARMYTLLVFETSLSCYFLLKVLDANHSATAAPPPGIPPPSSLLPALRPASLLLTPYSLFYALTATTALYTHYFAAFLLFAHAVYVGLILWQRNWPRRLLGQTLLMFGLTTLLFVPWLPTLLARLGDDPSYWPGALKLNEAMRQLLISFSVGETVFEQTGLWLALGYLIFLISAAIWAIAYRQKSAGRQSSFTSYNLTFLLLWLLLPIVFILALSYRSPKFNPRYTLLAWPAFNLLLAAALTRFFAPLTGLHRSALLTLRSSLFPLALLFFLATSGFSLFNWFTDIRFSKDDFKALAQFVRDRIAADETVLLSSGHLFPVWAYYYGWDNWTSLPWMQRLDVSQVTDLSISTDIAQAVAGKEGVWLVTWQDEVIDPNGVVPFWLDRIGQRPHDAGDFYGVGLEHWRLNPRRFELLHDDPIERPTKVNFANQVDLLGMTQLSDTELVLFWQPRQPLPNNLILTLDLTDQDGFSWDQDTIVGPPGRDTYPPARWPVGQIVLTRYYLPWQIGTPPGLYLAKIGLGQTGSTGFTGWDILDEQGRPQRRTALLESVNLSDLVRPETGPPPMDENPLVNFFPIVAVRRSILPQTSAEPGDRRLLALVWQAGEFNLDNISVAFDLVDTAGQSWRVGSSLTPSRRFNLPRWQPGDLVLGQYWLNIPPEVASGPARLQLHLLNQGAFVYDEIFPLDQLDILPTERNFTPPAQVDLPLEADFSGQARLIGLDCSTWTGTECRARPGEPVTVTLYWRANGPLDKNYTVFTHLLDANETVLVNADHAPPRPTRGWAAAEIVADPVTLTVPADLAIGEYALEVGLYDAADPAFSRLPLTTGKNRVILSPFLRVE